MLFELPGVSDSKLGEPTWKEEHLVRLLKERLHRIELSAPIVLRLDASKLETAAPESDTLFPEPGGSKEDHARLLELLVARFGEGLRRIPTALRVVDRRAKQSRRRFA
jgi:protein ImuB